MSIESTTSTPGGNVAFTPIFAIPAPINLKERAERAARRAALVVEKKEPAPSVQARASSSEIDDFNKKIDEAFKKSKMREFNKNWGVGPAAARAKSKNPSPIPKTSFRKRLFSKRVDNDGFAIPAPVNCSERATKRAAINKENEEPAHPISVKTGRPLSPETIEYARRMKETMEKFDRERYRKEVESIKEQWQDGLAKKNSGEGSLS